MTGPIDEAKTVLYRLMGVFDHADFFVDFDHRDNAAVALFLTFRPTQNFEFNVQVERYDKRQAGPSGLGTIPVNPLLNVNGARLVIPGYNDRPLNLPRNFSIGDPGMWDNQPFVVRRMLYAYDWSYRFDEKWKLTNRLHYSGANDSDYGFETYGGFNGTTIDRAFYTDRNTNQTLSTNLDLSGELETGPITIVLSLESIGSPPNGIPTALTTTAIRSTSMRRSMAFSIPSSHSTVTSQGRIRSGARRSEISASMRRTRSPFSTTAFTCCSAARWDTAQTGFPKTYGDGWANCWPFCSGFPGNHYKDKPKLSPRAAVLFKITDDTFVYGELNVRSFGSNNGVSADGTVYPPEGSLQWEVGLKETMVRRQGDDKPGIVRPHKEECSRARPDESEFQPRRRRREQPRRRVRHRRGSPPTIRHTIASSTFDL